jgi:hypothetical protein
LGREFPPVSLSTTPYKDKYIMAKATPTVPEMSPEEIEERALEADRLARYGGSDPFGLPYETQRSEEALAAKYQK